MAATARHSYPVADIARIRTSGQRTIQVIHNTGCPTLSQTGNCTCKSVTYRLITASKAVRR